MYTSNYAPETVITLDNVKEILANMGVEYTLKKRSDVMSKPSIYKDGKAYEIKGTNNLRSGLGNGHKPNTRLFLEGKTIQEVLDFLNGTKEKEEKEKAVGESSDNIIKRPGLQASATITVAPDGPHITLKDIRPISMEAMYSLAPDRAELLNRILRGPKKRNHAVRKGHERIGDNRKPTYDVTTDKLSEIVVHNAKSGTSAYSKEMLAITKSCEYQIPAVAPGEPYDGHQFQWAAEMPMEKLIATLSEMKAAKCKTYADWQRKKAKQNKVAEPSNMNVSNDLAIQMIAAMKELTELLRELK